MSATVRCATEKDAESVRAIYSPIVAETAISFEYEPPSTGEMLRRIAETSVRFPFIVCERDGVVAGYAYATSHRKREAYQWAAEVSVFTDRRHRRKGVGTSLYEALLDILRLQGFCHAFAVITVPNPPSIAFHESLGFRRIATCKDIGFKLGYWRDTGWWHLGLRKLPARPVAPRPFSAIRDSPPVQRALDEAVAGRKG